ncbi:MAG TPA: hypothetical protein EYG86_03420 [Crocinitomicaceae bacterium]|nr:hypothetical protein [Crocinitomicaceae bacterium]
MKLLTLTTTLLFAINLNAQTNIIANKSHSGDLSNLEQEPDDFGIPDNYFKRNVDSVIYYKKTCFIEVRKEHQTQNTFTYRRDTICSKHVLLEDKNQFDSFKSRYPASTVFIGFEKSKKTKVNRKSTVKKNAVPLFIGFVILLATLYSFLPLLRKKA